MALSNPELACVYAALVLVDDDVAVTVSTSSKWISMQNYNFNYFRVKKSPHSWKQPTLRSSHTGQDSSPRLLKELTSRTWSQTLDQESELPQPPLHQLPVINNLSLLVSLNINKSFYRFSRRRTRWSQEGRKEGGIWRWKRWRYGLRSLRLNIVFHSSTK